MTKKGKILFLLASASLILLVYLVFSSQPFSLPDGSQPPAKTAQKIKTPPVDMKLLEENYKKSAVAVLNDYETALRKFGIELSDKTASSAAVTADGTNILTKEEIIENINLTRNRLLDLKLPEQFMDLHHDLVFSLDKMENFVNEKNEQELITSRKLIKDARDKYAWLDSSRTEAN